MERCHHDQQSSVQSELKKEMSLLQKRILMDTVSRTCIHLNYLICIMLIHVNNSIFYMYMYFQIVYFTYDKHILCMLLHFSTCMVYKYFFSYSNSKKWPMLESPCKQCSFKETIIVMKNLFQYFQIMMFFVFAFILINLLIVQSLCLLTLKFSAVNKEKLTVLLIIFSNLRQHQ